MRKAGRPAAVIDWNKVGQYLQAQCMVTGIATLFGITADTLYLRCKKDNNMDFTAFSEQKRAEGKELLRAKLFDLAMSGNLSACIWLSKQYLGMRDQIEQTVNLPQINVQAMDEVEAKLVNEALDALENFESCEKEEETIP